jgi:hypothetical protein
MGSDRGGVRWASGRGVGDAEPRPRCTGRHARWMAVAFAAGATCCLIGPFPGYLALVGPVADSLTFFVGPLLFTAGGALQVLLAAAERGDAGTGRAAWRTATVQFAGTMFFDITTFRALQTALSDPDYDRLPAARYRPPGLRPLRRCGDRRLRGPSDRLGARPGRCELEHRGRRGLLPRLRGRGPGRRGRGPATSIGAGAAWAWSARPTPEADGVASCGRNPFCSPEPAAFSPSVAVGG